MEFSNKICHNGRVTEYCGPVFYRRDGPSANRDVPSWTNDISQQGRSFLDEWQNQVMERKAMEKRLTVPYLDQTTAAPTGCESVSTVMLLNYLGIQVTIREFIDRYLEKGLFHKEDGTPLSCSVFEEEGAQKGLLPDGGKLIGPDPRNVFAGDPYDRDAMGCYAPVIVSAINRVFAEKKFPCTAVDKTGEPLSKLVEHYVGQKDMPLLCWCTIDRDNAVVGPCWYLENGRKFTWLSREHCVLITGYDEENYIIHDSWNNNGIVTVERTLFEKGWREQYLQAVAIDRKETHGR